MSSTNILFILVFGTQDKIIVDNTHLLVVEHLYNIPFKKCLSLYTLLQIFYYIDFFAIHRIFHLILLLKGAIKNNIII